MTLNHGGPGGGSARDCDQVVAYPKRRGLDPLRPESAIVMRQAAPAPEPEAPQTAPNTTAEA